MKNRQYNYLFKMVLVGNSNVGKSSIVLRFADGEFNETYITTIGVDFRFKSLEFDDKKVKLQIWDTAGQERFRTITSSYYKGAHAIIITYDITSKDSFNDAVKYWYQEIKSHCPSQTQIILVGNKSDLSSQRQVSQQDVEEFAKPHNIEYIQTSAKESDNIEAAFIKVSKLLIARHDLKQEQIGKNSKGKKKSKKKEEPAQNQPKVAQQEPVIVEQEPPQKLILKRSKETRRGCCPY